MKLYDIGTVMAGYAFRGAIRPDNAGDTYVFQAKDLVQGVPCEDASLLTRISRDTSGYSGHLRKNDVLVVARGMKSGSFRSTTFFSDKPNVIASSSIHVIRITKPGVIPEYVSHYLNSKDGQEALSQIVSGSYIGAIPRHKLEKIDIPIPPLEIQELLVKLFRNIREQQRILKREEEIKDNIINATFKTLLA